MDSDLEAFSHVFSHIIAYNYAVINFPLHSYGEKLHYGCYFITFVYIGIYVYIVMHTHAHTNTHRTGDYYLCILPCGTDQKFILTRC